MPDEEEKPWWEDPNKKRAYLDASANLGPVMLKRAFITLVQLFICIALVILIFKHLGSVNIMLGLFTVALGAIPMGAWVIARFALYDLVEREDGSIQKVKFKSRINWKQFFRLSAISWGVVAAGFGLNVMVLLLLEGDVLGFNTEGPYALTVIILYLVTSMGIFTFFCSNVFSYTLCREEKATREFLLTKPLTKPSGAPTDPY